MFGFSTGGTSQIDFWPFLSYLEGVPRSRVYSLLGEVPKRGMEQIDRKREQTVTIVRTFCLQNCGRPVILPLFSYVYLG